MREFSILLFIIISFGLRSQNIPIGTWRTHFNYESAHLVTKTNSKIYCASKNGLFNVDLTDKSINILSKIDGLSDAQISAMAFSQENSVLVVGYSNGNIDLITNSEIFNIDLIKRENIVESKSIHHISFYDERAFLSTDFGIVVLNLANKTIREVFREIGPEGQTVSVEETAIFQDSLFAITNFGPLKAFLADKRNLLDFNNWDRLFPADSIFSIVESTNLGLLLSDGEQLILRDENGNNQLQSTLNNFIKDIKYSDEINIIYQNEITSWDWNVESPVEILNTNSPADIIKIEGSYWLADEEVGLIEYNASEEAILIPSGPHTDNIQKVVAQNGELYAFGDFRTDFHNIGNTSEYSLFQNGVWKITEHSGVYNPSNVSEDYLATFGSGVFDLGSQKTLTENGLNPPFEKGSGSDSVIITGGAVTSHGNWFLNFDTDPSLHLLDEEGDWHSYFTNFRFPNSVSKSISERLIISSAPAFSNGILIFDPDLESFQVLTSGNSDLPSNTVNDIAVDLDDELWMATNKGVAYLPSASTDISSGFNTVIIPIFQNSFLFLNENVNCIEVDPGNRKWIGTNNGIWLFEEAAQSIVYHFNTSNSPLPSDIILDVAIDAATGEVFILTSKGLMSYRSDATTGEPLFGDIKIFPNPVSPGYNGNVGISGLANDVNIKITDIRGSLIRELSANGGSASWDLRDYNGAPGQSGVYLFFASDPLGVETLIGKILVLK